MLTIIIPMAGRGSRFKDVGYEYPKPFIDVAGVPMVERVRANLPQADKLIVVALEEHAPLVREWLAKVNTAEKLNYPMGIHTTYIPEVTAGAACTVYGVMEEVHPESELLVANSDQWLDWSPAHFIDFCRRSGADGVIPCFRDTDPKWSFLLLRDNGTVRETIEKVVVSEWATCGLYYWQRAKACFSSIERMVKEDVQVNSEWYLVPSYNRLIRDDGAVIVPYPVPRMVGLGTPMDLEKALIESHINGWTDSGWPA